MVDVTDSDGQDFAVTFPANARMAALAFAGHDLHISLEDGGAERVVSSADVAALHGASIRRETVLPDVGRPSSLMDKVFGTERVEVQEALQHVLAIRASGVGELWYLVADTFNFRSALGTDTSMLLEANLKRLVQRLAAFAPNAVQDAYVTAMLAGSPLPPPLDSLLEFLRISSR